MMGSFNRDTVARACRRFSSRIEAVIAADGNFIELVNSQYIPLVYFFTSIQSDHFQLCCGMFNETF